MDERVTQTGPGTGPDSHEAVVRFAYSLAPRQRPLAANALAELQAWRSIFLRLGLVGQDADRYGGHGFGNVSGRDPDDADAFLITAGQTEHLDTLDDEHWVRVSGASLERFWVDAEGAMPPSSETMTHAAAYAADRRVRFVFHVRSPDIWRRAEDLRLPHTPPDVACGTPDMAQAVADLFEQHVSRPIVFATAGHADGLFSCGPLARDAGALIVTSYAKALAAASSET